MTEKIYLFKRAADGVWIYGPNADCEHPSGACRIIPNTARDKVSIIYLAKSDGKFDRNDVPVTSFYKEDGNNYADFAALKAGYAGFFFKPIYLTQEAADERYPQIADGQAAYVKECLYTKTTQIANTGNTTENTVLTFTLPAGKMGPNGYLNIFLNISHTSNTNYKSANIYINGTKVGMASSNGLAGAGSRHLFTIVNRNSVSSQVFSNPAYVASGQYSGNLSSSSTPATASINTNAEMTVTVTLQCATSASDTVNLEFLLVESVYQPAAS